MSLRSLVGAAATAGAILSSFGFAWGQLQITTLVGRQIGDGRPATAASLDRPFGVEFAADGALLIADRGHARIRRVDPATGVITTLVGSVPGGRNNVPADQGELKGPLRVHVDPLDRRPRHHRPRRAHDPAGVRGDGHPRRASRAPTTPPAPPATADSPSTRAARSARPTPSRTTAGGVLIADRNNHKIRRIDALGVINTVAGTGVAGLRGRQRPRRRAAGAAQRADLRPAHPQPPAAAASSSATS